MGTQLYSGIALSTDGSVLAVCDSFNDFLRLYDTATRTQVAQVPVGGFPISVAFSPNGTKAYVANPLGDSVSVVSVNGASSFLEVTVPGIDLPITVDVDAAGSFVYVGNAGAAGAIRVIDSSTTTIVQTVLFASGAVHDTYLSPTDSILYVASSNPEMLRISAAGPTSAIIDVTPLTSTAQDVVFSEVTRTAVFGEPFSDGVEIVVSADGLSQFVDCMAGPNTAPPLSGECPDLCLDAFDADADGDVDLIDFASFQISFGAP